MQRFQIIKNYYAYYDNEAPQGNGWNKLGSVEKCKYYGIE